MVKVKIEILFLLVIIVNGYYVENREELVVNKEMFDILFFVFFDDLFCLNLFMLNNVVVSNVVDVSLVYVNSSNDMYIVINE